ncbi:MAG: ATP-binding protein [Candidatus Altiarchaeota archaeon]
MKINKVQAYAFAISEYIESHFLDSISKKSSGRSELKKGYTPLVLCNALGSGRNTGKSNKFFMNLVSGEIYFLQSRGYVDSIKKVISRDNEPETPELAKSDLLPKIKNFPPEFVKEFGLLMESGTTRVVGLDQNRLAILRELVGLNFAETYMHQATEYVKPKVRIPLFDSSVFDLSNHFELVSIVDDSYARERLIYVPQQLCALIALLYECSVSIGAIVYLPYLKASYTAGGQINTEVCVSAYPKNTKHKLRKYEHPVELKSIMLGIKGEGMTATPLESSIIDFSDVAGMDGVKETIRQAIIYPLKNPQLSREFGRKAGGGILLYGPPGCGKTFIVRATVGEAGVNFFTVNVQDIIGLDPMIGAKKLHDVFEETRSNSPSVIFFDEVDALSGVRDSNQSSQERMVINQFLSEMDGLASVNENVLVIGATNIPWRVDPALRRSGRFTAKIYIPPPDFEARKAVFSSSLKKKPVGNIDFVRLSELTDGYSSADISALCDDASKIPWSESLKGKPKRAISMNDFLTVLDGRKSSLIPWFNLAKTELESSGEAELYGNLINYIKSRSSHVDSTKNQDVVVPVIEYEKPKPSEDAVKEKRLVEQAITILKKKYSSGGISEDVYKELLREYEMKLIAFEDKSS